MYGTGTMRFETGIRGMELGQGAYNWDEEVWNWD